jgi:hypothetical protein
MTQAFNLSQLANLVNTSGQLNAATGLFNQTPVANGGTGRSSVTSGALLLGAGTSAMTELAGTTPGTVIGSSPTGWSAVPTTSVGGGDYIMRTYTSPSPWTAPASLKAVKVTVIGGGGNGGNAIGVSPGFLPVMKGGGGGSGGFVQTYFDAPAVSPLTITAGAGTNSFGALVSCTGGSVGGSTPNSTNSAGGAGGTATPSPTNLIQINGFTGGPASPTGAGGNTNSIGGGGANTFGGLGFGGDGTLAAVNAVGNNAVGYGAGGAGGTRSSGASPLVGTTPGGTGAPGIVIVEEFY